MSSQQLSPNLHLQESPALFWGIAGGSINSGFPPELRLNCPDMFEAMKGQLETVVEKLTHRSRRERVGGNGNVNKATISRLD